MALEALQGHKSLAQAGIFSWGATTGLERRRKWLIRLAVIAVALLIHALLLVVELPWDKMVSVAPVESVSVQDLAALKKKWNEPEALLLTPNKETAQEKPNNSRYMSDKNRVYERQQRSMHTDVLPQRGLDQVQTPDQVSDEQSAKQESATSFPIHNMGINPFESLRSQPMQSTSQRPAGLQSLDQTILDNSLSMGSEQMIDSQESIYYSFFSRMYEKTAPIWKRRIHAQMHSAMPGVYITQIEVVLDSKGHVKDVHVIKPSGHQGFDMAAHECWHAAESFPNPPKGLIDSNGEIRKRVTFQVSIGTNGF
jgi:TonB family protein